MNKQSASTALEESPSSRAAASPHNELLMRFPLSGQLISISPDMRFQRTGIFNLEFPQNGRIYFLCILLLLPHLLVGCRLRLSLYSLQSNILMSRPHQLYNTTASRKPNKKLMEISLPQASQLTTSYYASISISTPDLNSITRLSAFTIIFSRSPRTKSSLYSLTSCVIALSM